MPSLGLSREGILQLLEELGAELHSRGDTASIYVAGGAAMVLQYGRTTATADVDSVFESEQNLVAMADDVADRLGFQRGWLTTGVTAFVPNERDTEAVSMSFGALTVRVASATHMLAMKMRAVRSKDWGDIVLLVRQLELSTPEQVTDLVHRFFDEDSVPSETREETMKNAERAFRFLK